MEERIYKYIRKLCLDMGDIPEIAIVYFVGIMGLDILKETEFIEICRTDNAGRPLYKLCCEEGS